MRERTAFVAGAEIARQRGVHLAHYFIVMKPHRTLGLAVVLALVACEPYELVPVDPYNYVTSGNVAPNSVGNDITPGGVAADYPIPKDSPRGDLRIASYGLVDVGPQSQSDKRIQAVHLRMTVINNSDLPWTLDTRQQRIDVEGYGTSVAAFASANAGSSPPTITVPAKGKRVVDLFFPLPAQLQKAEQLPALEAVWSVQTDDELVTDRTPFEQIAVQPPATYDATYDYGPDYYWGPPYWYNPYYAEYGFGLTFPFYFGYGYPLYVHHHGYYGHFAHHGYYGYAHGGYYHGYPYGGYYHGYSHGGYYRGYPYGGGYYRGYPGGYYRGGYPHGGYPGYPQQHYGHPSGGHPGGGFHPGGGGHGGGHGGGGHGGGGGHR